MAFIRAPQNTCGKRGYLELIVGPMFSGKTSQLQNAAVRYGYANVSCIVIKYEGDTRYSDEPLVINHARQVCEAVSCRKLSDIEYLVDEHDVVLIDEGQFFPDLHEFCAKYADAGKRVIVAALDATFKRESFEQVCSLVPLADKVTKLRAVCVQCGQDAIFSFRDSASQELTIVGGADQYRALCRDCFCAEEALLHDKLSGEGDAHRQEVTHCGTATGVFGP